MATQENRPRNCAAIAGSARTICARSAIARGCASSAMTRRLGRQAGHRHHQYLERHQRLPRPSARPRRGRKRGVYQAGGFPIELPAMSLAEPFVKPSTMLYRNFLAMECEELLRSHPIDGAVLMGGCDKTTPGLIMGAISMGIPAIYVPAGPMLRGNWRGQRSARAPTPGNIGTRNAPAASAMRSGTRSRAAFRARSAPAW